MGIIITSLEGYLSVHDLCKVAGAAPGPEQALPTCWLPPLPRPVNMGQWPWDGGRDYELPLSLASTCLFRPPSEGCPVAGGLPLSFRPYTVWLVQAAARHLRETEAPATPEILSPVPCRWAEAKERTSGSSEGSQRLPAITRGERAHQQCYLEGGPH